MPPQWPHRTPLPRPAHDPRPQRHPDFDAMNAPDPLAPPHATAPLPDMPPTALHRALNAARQEPPRPAAKAQLQRQDDALHGAPWLLTTPLPRPAADPACRGLPSPPHHGRLDRDPGPCRELPIASAQARHVGAAQADSRTTGLLRQGLDRPAGRASPPAALAPSARAAARAGHVTLAGAGPGDPELLTLKALHAIESAEVVLHDQLVSPAILALVPPSAERIDVGKRCGHHRYSQAAIIELMLELARQGRRVLRLKGGDPNIFGRGGEEAQALAAAGVAFDFIPGISAAQAASSCAGIPLTHRDHARAVVYATAHLREDGQPHAGGAEPDWAALARPGQTVVLYMGAASVDRICQRLQAHGLAPDTPAALVERASQPGQRTLLGTLQTLPARTALAALHGPAVIIVGSVVHLAEQLSPQATAVA